MSTRPTIVLADHAGFCFGVERAVRLAQEAAQGGAVYTLGPLIHNEQAVQRLRQLGVQPVENVEEAAGGVLVIRSHGIPPEVAQQAAKVCSRVIDATCPFVRRVQQRARTLLDEGYAVVIVGERNHPEVLGILGHVDGQAHVVERPAEVAQLPPLDRVGLVAQTTQTRENFEAVARALRGRCRELVICETMCSATELRQAAAAELSRRADVMIIVGGRHSGNTRRLVEVARAYCPATYHVETADEIDPEWVRSATTIGVTAGASTPDEVTQEVLTRLNSLLPGLAASA